MNDRHPDARLDRRERAVAAALGSVRAEGLEPSQYTLRLLQDYADGKITAKEIRKQALDHVKQKARKS